jgi:peptide deformylase
MDQLKIMQRTQFGDPILTEPARKLSLQEISQDSTKQLIANMKYTLQHKKYGVGLAAPQVGVSLAISVIHIKKTPTRPDREDFELTIINPTYTGVGKKEKMWEGCLSFGAINSPVFAQTKRYAAVEAHYWDEHGEEHSVELAGLAAHVFQHEVDHLEGVLFPQRVEDHTTWMNASEYKKRIVNKSKK